MFAQTGDIVTTLGPDVFTSCGTLGRVLTLGEEYVVGIGGACNPISEWTTLESYTESEIELLKSLRDWTPSESYTESEVELLDSLQQQCAEDSSTCSGTSGSHLIDLVLLLPLVALTALLTY